MTAMTNRQIREIQLLLRELPFNLESWNGSFASEKVTELVALMNKPDTFLKKGIINSLPSPATVYPEEYGEDDEVAETWDTWILYRKTDKKKPIGKMTASSQIKKLKTYGREAWVTAICRAIEQGWIGFFPEKETTQTTVTKNASKWDSLISNVKEKVFNENSSSNGMNNKEYLNYIRERERDGKG